MALSWLATANIAPGTRVLLRADFNVPVENGVVVDDFRITQALPTLDFLLNKGARVCVVSHIESGEKTLRPVADYFKKKGREMLFYDGPLEDFSDFLKINGNPQCVLLENVRRFPGEEANDEVLARSLASLGAVFVNDAFSVSHRAHASVVGIPRFCPALGGLLFEKEFANLSRVFSPRHPFVFILGGAKFDTKIPLLSRFLETADSVFLMGALANTALKMRGYEVGGSVVDPATPEIAEILKNKKVLIPEDAIVTGARGTRLCLVGEVGAQEKIVDAGPRTVAVMEAVLRESAFVLWNGPLGIYEAGYHEGTEALAKAVANSGIYSIVGGGDTVAAIRHLNLMHRFGFVSTAGGAMLDFLASETLPGIEALQKY